MKDQKDLIHKDQSVIPASAYKHVKGSLESDTIKKLNAAGKQIVPKKVLKKTQLSMESLYEKS